MILIDLCQNEKDSLKKKVPPQHEINENKCKLSYTYQGSTFSRYSWNVKDYFSYFILLYPFFLLFSRKTK